MPYYVDDSALKSIQCLCDYHIEEYSKLYTIEEICNFIRSELNKVFPDFRCTRVVYNPNTDKPMFGIMIRPEISDHYIIRLFGGLVNSADYPVPEKFEEFKFEQYQIEIDGKILAGNLLSAAQVFAIIFNEISMMNSAKPVYQLRAMIDTYIAKKETHIKIDKIWQSIKTFKMCMAVTLHNLTSAFARYGEDISKPLQFTKETGFGEKYTSAINTLKQSIDWPQPLADMTGFMMVWYFNNYHWIRQNRTLEYVFRDAIETESSILIKQMINDALESNVMVIEKDKEYYKSITEASNRKGLIWQMKRNGIKSIEEDLFEYNMRIRNIETEDDAIILMRQINSRMSILEDYIREENIDDVDRKRWSECYSKYVELRNELSKKTLYKRKQMGLWMDYNYLSDDSGTPESQTYY